MKNRGIRVAMISEHASPMALLGGEDAGGQNVYVDELSRHLVPLGFEVDVFTRLESESAREVNQWADGVRVINVRAGPATYLKKDLLLEHMSEFRDNMLRFARDNNVRYDAIHAHFWMSGWVGCEISSIWGVPLVQTFHALGVIKRIHQGKADTSPEERLSVERRIAREVDRVVATCPVEKEDLEHYYGCDPGKVTVIPCGVNTSIFEPVDRAVARRELQLSETDKVVVYVGRVLPRKGIDNVVEGVAELCRSTAHQVVLVIVGGETDQAMPDNDQEMGRLAELARSLGIADRVRFTGRRAQSALKLYYSAADVCVTTPWYEPFGMVPLEAMACGTPVIAAAVGGLKFSVVDHVTGFLVPPKDPAALAEKLDLVLSNDEMRRRQGNRARKRVEQWFTWPKVAARIAAVYEELIYDQAFRRRSHSDVFPKDIPGNNVDQSGGPNPPTAQRHRFRSDRG